MKRKYPLYFHFFIALVGIVLILLVLIQRYYMALILAGFIAGLGLLTEAGLYLLYRSKRRKVVVHGKTYVAYVADNPLTRAVGYMFRDPGDLEKNEAILFRFGEDGEKEFWMLNMNFDVELVSLDTGKRVRLNRGNKVRIKGKSILEIPIRES